MSRTALYRYFGADGRLLYVGITARLKQRNLEHASKAPWIAEAVRMETWWLPSREEAVAAEAAAIRDEKPVYNRTMQRGDLGFCDVPTGVTLRDWLAENKVTQKEFSAHIGITQGVLSRLCAGHMQPRIETAILIQRATRGEVLPASWVRTKVPA